MSSIIKNVALCYYPDGEAAGTCCFNRFTMNDPPQKQSTYQMARCNGDCGREVCLCIVMKPEEVIPRPPHTLMGQTPAKRTGHVPKKRAGLKKPTAKKK